MLDRLAPAGARGRLSVLVFHRVLPEPDPLFPEEMHHELFEARLRWLKRWFNVVSAETAIDGLCSGDLPARAALITFDDGYADNFEVALPLLQRYDCQATFFVTTDFLDGGRMFNDTVIQAMRLSAAAHLDLRDLNLGLHPLGDSAQRRAAIEAVLPKLKYFEPDERARAVGLIAQRAQARLPDNLMMTSQQVRKMRAAGMTIGAHTRTHPILLRLNDAEARREIEQGRRLLEDITQQPVEFFAYPNGRPGQDYDARHVRLVRELGFRAAFSTVWGSAAGGCDLYQIPRFSPWDRTPYRFALRMAQNLRREPQGLA